MSTLLGDVLVGGWVDEESGAEEPSSLGLLGGFEVGQSLLGGDGQGDGIGPTPPSSLGRTHILHGDVAAENVNEPRQLTLYGEVGAVNIPVFRQLTLQGDVAAANLSASIERSVQLYGDVAAAVASNRTLTLYGNVANSIPRIYNFTLGVATDTMRDQTGDDVRKVTPLPSYYT